MMAYNHSGVGPARTEFAYITDPRGSVRLVVQLDNGEVVQRLDYGPFGEVILDSSPGFQPFGYAGGIYDADTGLVRFGARDYDAETGRWLTRDPIGFAAGDANLFAYVGGDPVNSVDPTGLDTLGVGFRLGGCAGFICLEVGVTAVMDDHWNLDLNLSGSVGGGNEPLGGYVTGAVQSTDLDHIDQLTGAGRSYCGAGGEGLVASASLLTSGTANSGFGQIVGMEYQLGLGMGFSPVDVIGLATNSFNVLQFLRGLSR
jgi:RHS repeat-associated protein